MWLYSILLAATQLIYRRNEYLSVTSQCTLVLPFRHINTHKQGQVWVVVSNKKKNTQIYKNDILITFSTSLEELWGICLRTTLKKGYICVCSLNQKVSHPSHLIQVIIVSENLQCVSKFITLAQLSWRALKFNLLCFTCTVIHSKFWYEMFYLLTFSCENVCLLSTIVKQGTKLSAKV